MNRTPDTLRDPREVIREEMAMQRPLLQALAEGPLSLPALAERLHRPVEEVVYWVMGMRRYGLLAETGDADDDGYFAYAATDRGRRRAGQA
jgi:predicted transcriptional regulator